MVSWSFLCTGSIRVSYALCIAKNWGCELEEEVVVNLSGWEWRTADL